MLLSRQREPEDGLSKSRCGKEEERSEDSNDVRVYCVRTHDRFGKWCAVTRHAGLRDALYIY